MRRSVHVNVPGPDPPGAKLWSAPVFRRDSTPAGSRRNAPMPSPETPSGSRTLSRLLANSRPAFSPASHSLPGPPRHRPRGRRRRSRRRYLPRQLSIAMTGCYASSCWLACSRNQPLLQLLHPQLGPVGAWRGGRDACLPRASFKVDCCSFSSLRAEKRGTNHWSRSLSCLLVRLRSSAQWAVAPRPYTWTKHVWFLACFAVYCSCLLCS
jgi:hypothetical protein